MFELVEDHAMMPRIKVIGLGSGGVKIIDALQIENEEGIESIRVPTLQVGINRAVLQHENVRAVQGAGGNVLRAHFGGGQQSEWGDVSAHLQGANMVILLACLGGNTGTQLAPVWAQTAKALGILTVAIVTRPFNFEGHKRQEAANSSLENLARHVDSLVAISNENMLKLIGTEAPLASIFNTIDAIMSQAARGIADLFAKPGLIQVDFQDFQAIFSDMGVAALGLGQAHGKHRATAAATDALMSPLWGNLDIRGAKGFMLNVTAGIDLAISEFHQVIEKIREQVGESVPMVVGATIDNNMRDELRVTLIATGISQTSSPKAANPPPMRIVRHKDAMDVDPLYWERVATRVSKHSNKPNDPLANLDYLNIPAFLRRQAD